MPSVTSDFETLCAAEPGNHEPCRAEVARLRRLLDPTSIDTVDALAAELVPFTVDENAEDDLITAQAAAEAALAWLGRQA